MTTQLLHIMVATSSLIKYKTNKMLPNITFTRNLNVVVLQRYSIFE